MIRSAFLRRMAQVAMAGMLGAELMWRAPKVAFTATEALARLDNLPRFYGVGIMDLMVEEQVYINRVHAARLEVMRSAP